MAVQSFEEILKRNRQREEDGFRGKVKIRRLLVGSNRIIVIPYVEEEKLIHGNFEPTGEHGEDEAGYGEGEIGDIVLEIPLLRRGDGDGDDGEEGDGDGDEEGESQVGEGEGEHGIETDAYQLGKELAEKLQLPNLKDKSKKVPTDEYAYDLTDRHRGSGQLLDKKETLRSVIKTNMILGRFDINNPDTTKLVVGPRDKVYRVLSKEKVWKSQAVVFFLRDYSGSMAGDPTQAVINQHLMIYSWLLFEYKGLVIPRFIVHDTEAKEVSINNYFSSISNGGTFIPSGYIKINEIVEDENLAQGYNIYIFQGTDGDDGDNGEKAISELEKIFGYANRIGVTVLKTSYSRNRESRFEGYIKEAGLIDKKELFRMHVMPSDDITDKDNEEAIKALVVEN